MKNLNLRGIVVGPVMTNCYFLKNTQSGEILVVDPAAEAERICRTVERIEGKPAGMFSFAITVSSWLWACAESQICFGEKVHRFLCL